LTLQKECQTKRRRRPSSMRQIYLKISTHFEVRDDDSILLDRYPFTSQADFFKSSGYQDITASGGVIRMDFPWRNGWERTHLSPHYWSGQGGEWRRQVWAGKSEIPQRISAGYPAEGGRISSGFWPKSVELREAKILPNNKDCLHFF